MEEFAESHEYEELYDYKIEQPRLYRERIDPFDQFTDREFRRRYRFTKSETKKIIDLFKEYLPKNESDRGKPISAELKILACLSGFARKRVQEDTGDLHGFSQATMSRINKEVSETIARRMPETIQFPSTVEEQIEVMKKFHELAAMPQIIGAIDCTHIKIKKTGGEHAQMFINRKGFYSLNVQVICDADCKIRNIIARWRGSVHDSRIFNESAIREKFEEGQFIGKLLGDSGYACTKYMLTPILQPRTRPEQKYNKAHIATRNVVERLFGQWKQRFRGLLHGLHTSLDTVKTSIVAMAVLHNIAIDIRAEDEWSSEEEDSDSDSDSDEPVDHTAAGNYTRNQYINKYFS